MKWKPPAPTRIVAAAFAVYTAALYLNLAYLITGNAMLPNGAGFALAILFTAAKTAEAMLKCLSTKRLPLPPLIGMVAAGLLLRNCSNMPLSDNVPFFGYDFKSWSVLLRSLALAVIMLRAGLGLDLRKLRTLGAITARLAFLPCIFETAAVGVTSHYLLGLPASWAGMLGFTVAAVSPAVLVPGMLELQDRNLGTNKGIPTLMMAAASFDDVLAVAGFGVCLTLVRQTEFGDDSASSLAWLVMKAPVEICAGCVAGLVIGAASALLGAEHVNVAVHTLATLGGAFVCVLGSRKIGFSSGGILAAVVIGSTISEFWRRTDRISQLEQVRSRVQKLWGDVAQPALFGLLGAAVDLRAVRSKDVGLGCALIAIGLVVRLLATRLALVKSRFSSREALFICISWLPKATVQAAVGGIALDIVMENGYWLAQDRAELVLMISLLVILITAPLGAIGIAVSAPKLLSHGVSEVAAANCNEGENLRAVRTERAIHHPESQVGHKHSLAKEEPSSTVGTV